VASVSGGFSVTNGETATTAIKGFTIHTWAGFWGAQGILCKGASPRIEDCRIWGCGIAGILCTNGASPAISNCVIEANAGGIVCYGGSPRIDRCLIVSNYSGQGAGVRPEGASALLLNSLIIGNRSTNDAGGIYVGSGCAPTGINCTIVGNDASNQGSALANAGSPVFKNLIVWGNIDPLDNPIYVLSGMSLTYSDLQMTYPGSGNTTNNPLFAAAGD
jgi:hypothetical protein